MSLIQSLAERSPIEEAGNFAGTILRRSVAEESVLTSLCKMLAAQKISNIKTYDTFPGLSVRYLLGPEGRDTQALQTLTKYAGLVAISGISSVHEPLPIRCSNLKIADTRKQRVFRLTLDSESKARLEEEQNKIFAALGEAAGTEIEPPNRPLDVGIVSLPKEAPKTSVTQVIHSIRDVLNHQDGLSVELLPLDYYPGPRLSKNPER